MLNQATEDRSMRSGGGDEEAWGRTVNLTQPLSRQVDHGAAFDKNITVGNI